jgi:hypothetical protein
MITFDAFLVFLAAASLPVIYLRIVSRWLEPEYKKAYPQVTLPKAPVRKARLLQKTA